MGDRYSSFAKLAENEIEGEDYSICVRSAPQSNILVMAPHGGGIEPYTTELADVIASVDFSFYTFKGIKSSGNGCLHITGTNFDEPRALEAASEAAMVLAIHGHADRSSEFVMVGGLAAEAMRQLEGALDSAGFQIRPPPPALRGSAQRNICNRGRSGEGVQFELSRGLRDRLKGDETTRQNFVNAVRQILEHQE